MKLFFHVGGLTLLAYSLVSALESCSPTSVTPCSCVSGTEYEQSATFAVIGASAQDVKALISDFYNTAWFGILPVATQGEDNVVGSIRSYNFPTAAGILAVKEELLELSSDATGSFTQKFELLPSLIPVEYPDGSGFLGGYWVTLEALSIFSNETAIRWSVYACSTGHPMNFASFHGSSLTNATNILQAAGKIDGSDLTPTSVQSF